MLNPELEKQNKTLRHELKDSQKYNRLLMEVVTEQNEMIDHMIEARKKLLGLSEHKKSCDICIYYDDCFLLDLKGNCPKFKLMPPPQYQKLK